MSHTRRYSRVIPQAVDFSDVMSGFRHDIRKLFRKTDDVQYKSEVKAFDKTCSALGFYLLPEPMLRALFFENENDRNLATVMFSSGSAGDPKGVMLTHTNISSNIEGLYQVFHTEDDDTVMGILPLFHSFGFSGTLWSPLITGMSVVYHSNPLDFNVIGEMVKNTRRLY